MSALALAPGSAAADGYRNPRPEVSYRVKKRFWRAWTCRCRTLAEIYRTPAQDYNVYYYNSYRRYARIRLYK